MPAEWIGWIIREMARDGKNMGFVDYFLNGDGLTEPRLPEILGLSKKWCPWLRTQTFTNGVLTENVDLILDRNLDSICFTISAHTPELYLKVHRGRRFEDAIRTLKIVLEKRHPRLNVEVHGVLTKDNIPYAQEWWDYFGRPEFAGVKRILSPLVASYDNKPSADSTGNYTLDQLEKIVIGIAGEEGRMWTRDLLPPSKPCVLWDNMSIDVEGYVLQCCNWSPPQDLNYGAVPELMDEGRHLKDVWQERLANRMRNRLCRSCNMKHPDWKQRLDRMNVDVTVKMKAPVKK